MTETRFTKGEWSYDKSDDTIYPISNNKIEICTITNVDKQKNGGMYVFKSESEANAHLIATAPDMYDMIDKINSMIMFSKNEIELADNVTSACHDIEQLLKKARGE